MGPVSPAVTGPSADASQTRDLNNLLRRQSSFHRPVITAYICKCNKRLPLAPNVRQANAPVRAFHTSPDDRCSGVNGGSLNIDWANSVSGHFH